jgi:hypothetical protein
MHTTGHFFCQKRGNYRQTVFESDEDHIQYLEWLKLYSKKYSLRIWAYCLMVNHIHLSQCRWRAIGCIAMGKTTQGTINSRCPNTVRHIHCITISMHGKPTKMVIDYNSLLKKNSKTSNA